MLCYSEYRLECLFWSNQHGSVAVAAMGLTALQRMVESHCSAPFPISLPPSELRCAPRKTPVVFSSSLKLTEGNH